MIWLIWLVNFATDLQTCNELLHNRLEIRYLYFYHNLILTKLLLCSFNAVFDKTAICVHAIIQLILTQLECIHRTDVLQKGYHVTLFWHFLLSLDSFGQVQMALDGCSLSKMPCPQVKQLLAVFQEYPVGRNMQHTFSYPSSPWHMGL